MKHNLKTGLKVQTKTDVFTIFDIKDGLVFFDEVAPYLTIEEVLQLNPKYKLDTIEHEDLGDVNDSALEKNILLCEYTYNELLAYKERYDVLLHRYNELSTSYSKVIKRRTELKIGLDCLKQTKTIKGFKLVDYGDESNE